LNNKAQDSFAAMQYLHVANKPAFRTRERTIITQFASVFPGA
jgi:hypothetical protein